MKRLEGDTFSKEMRETPVSLGSLVVAPGQAGANYRSITTELGSPIAVGKVALWEN